MTYQDTFEIDAREIEPNPSNRVPEVTPGFWLIKLMAVTMGETAADYLAVNLGLGLTVTTLIMSMILVIVLCWQFTQRRYVPTVYWASVVLISIVGTLVTDNLTDNLGVPLIDSTVVFMLALAGTFATWFASESARYRFMRSSRPDAKAFTGWRSCSHLPWALRPAIWSRSNSGLAIWQRGSCSV